MPDEMSVAGRTGGGVVLDLSPYRNNTACTLTGFGEPEGLDGFGRAFPAEELAELGPLVGGWPEKWGRGAPDNVACEGQRIALPEAVQVSAVGVLGTSTGGSFRDDLRLLPGGGARAPRVLTIGLTDFLAARPAFGETCHLACSRMRERDRDLPGLRPRLWRVEVTLPEPASCTAVELPVNPEMHVFGLWVWTATLDEGKQTR